MEERAYIDPGPRCGEEMRFSITINPLAHGYTVTVGCQTFAIESVESLISKLSAYLRNPQQVTAEWQQSKVLPV